MWPKYEKSSQRGQVLLLVVLASVIALTVGLAAVSRSITSTRISTEESNSQKALAAAEAGVEEQINKALTTTAGETLTDTEKDLNNNSSFIASAVPRGGNDFEINDGNIVDQDDGADVWLSEYPDFLDPKSTDLTVFWKTGATCTLDPAIEIVVLSGASADPDSKKNPSMRRYAVDGCSSRVGQNNFADPNVSASDIPDGYNLGYKISGITFGYIARIIPLYANANLAIRSTTALPPQGYTIESTGSSGDTVRKVQVSQKFPKLPIEFFPYNLFLP